MEMFYRRFSKKLFRPSIMVVDSSAENYSPSSSSPHRGEEQRDSYLPSSSSPHRGEDQRDLPSSSSPRGIRTGEELREEICDDPLIEEEKEHYKSLKRIRYSSRKNSKKARVEIIGKQTQPEGPIQRDPKKRWSADRYELAEKNLLALMKQKGATAESPVLMSELRAEARKVIGDTELIDHLLKHMAGKIAPGSQERFQRHKGPTVYWLESSDLNKAGVPPPDSPTQDPRELKLLELEEEVAKLRKKIELSSKRRQEESQSSIAVLRRSEISQKVDLLVSSLDKHVSLKKYKEQLMEKLMMVSDYVKKLEEKYNEQLMVVSDHVKKIEEIMEKLAQNM